MKSLKTFLVIAIMLFSTLGFTQFPNGYRATNAAIINTIDNSRIEKTLNKVTLSLSNNSHELTVRIPIPHNIMDSIPNMGNLNYPDDLVFELVVSIDPWQIQNYISSAKVYTTRARIGLNGSIISAQVEYMPQQQGSDLDGDFNLSMIIIFNSDDFNFRGVPKTSTSIIKIINAKVNRL